MPQRFSVLVRKLSALHSVSQDEQAALLAQVGDVRRYAKGDDIVADGSAPPHCTVMLDGLACRYKTLPDGGRQILQFQLPGDLTDLYSYVMKRMDHAVGALTTCEVAHIPHASIEQLSAAYPNLGYALWRDSLVDAAIVNMAVINNGRRNALERIAHLLCEQMHRLIAVELIGPGAPVSLRITQTDLGDATGLSLVHVNKTLRKLKDLGLLSITSGSLNITSPEGLKALAGFDPVYLHFKHMRRL